MSDDSKTEHVSQRRVAQAFEEGQVPLGREAVGVAALVASLLALGAVAPKLRMALTVLTAEALTGAASGSIELLLARAGLIGLWVVPVFLAASVTAVLVTMAQTQGGLWLHLALPDASRLWGGRLMRAFTREFAVDFGLTILKAAAVALVCWFALRDDVRALPGLLQVAPLDQVNGLLLPVMRVSVRVVVLMAGLAVADLALTHFRFRERMLMTREEAKREMKEEEGDPQIRARRRRRHREMSKGRAAVEVPKADALLVNPTHIAIAIRYRAGDQAPRVTAKGKGQLAEIMRDLARAHQIPIVEDIPLARLLYRRVKIGGRVPAETYRAVATILAFVYRVTGRRTGATA